MTERTRLKNGRFISEKILQRRKKSLEAMAEAKKRKQKKRSNINIIYEGNRIVNLQELGKNLKCCDCEEILSLENIIDETCEGLYSILTINCIKCNIKNKVCTGKKVESNGHTYSNVNLSAVLGAMSSGTGCTGLNKILSCLDIPVLSMNMFKRYEREVGPAVEKAAKESCEKAAMEERQLVISNLKRLCDTL